MDIPAEERFRVLCEITRAQHFAWREAALSLAPDLDPLELVRTIVPPAAMDSWMPSLATNSLTR